MTSAAAYLRRSRAWGAAVGVALAATAIVAVNGAATPAASQPTPIGAGTALPGDRMLLEADQLVYDFDSESVTAIGRVQIYYGGYYLDAERVAFDQRAGTLTASGGVRMVEPNGNVVTAETLTLTDDFRNGFLASLNVITTEKSRFSAQSGELRDGNLLIFRNGVYTACAPCLDNPDKPPLWQIKAARIVHDQSTRTVYYRDARFELFGVPIAYLPFLSHPDPSVKRKSGLLMPTLLQSDAIGFGVTTPFFWNLAPNYDVTFAPTYLTRQGLLMQTEWRHRVLNGSYSIRAAGIFQKDKDEFIEDGERLSGYRDFRGSMRTTAEFAINSRWSVGWDLHATTDRTFNRDYKIEGATEKDLTSTVYLTGLSERNYFDVRGYYFTVQRENTVEQLADDGDPTTVDTYTHDDQDEQGIVHPVIDYNYIVDRPVLGGELRFDSNLQSVSREESDIRHPDPPFAPYFAGVAGASSRLSSQVQWRRQFIGPAGQVFTPIAYLQGDASYVDATDPAAGLASGEMIGRAMPAAALQYEWPFVATLGGIVQTFGPKAQIVLRPDEMHAGDLPNEDAQSLVFDDTTLFVLDKFSGYDRQEGGTRANIGLVYQGLFPNGASVDALFGQSYQLAGSNSFAMQDNALTGIGSGLESDESDYVGRVTVNSGTGVAVTARGRLDDSSFELNHGELNAMAAYHENLVSVGYTFIRESPSAGILEDRQEIGGGAALALSHNWSALGSLIYDIENGSRVSHSLGLAYSDECLDLSAIYSETPDQYSDLVTDREFFVRVSLRTLTDSGGGSSFDDAIR